MGVIPKTYPGAGRPPRPDSIEEGELALNTGDGTLYTKLRSGRVVEVRGRDSGSVVISEAPASAMTAIVRLSQQEYQAIVPDPDTLYVIV